MNSMMGFRQLFNGGLINDHATGSDLLELRISTKKKRHETAIYIVWGYSLKFRPDIYIYTHIYINIGLRYVRYL